MEEWLIEGLIIEPHHNPQKVSLINDVEIFSFLISETAPDICNIGILPLNSDACIIYNADASLHKLEKNRKIGNKTLHGIFYIVGLNDFGNISSLNHNSLKKYYKLFKDNEIIL